MIYDCFSFFGSDAELDILDLKLNELNYIVDKFVLVEATMTHSGIWKPLYYWENKDRFSEFSHKIIHVVVEDMPFTSEQIQSAITPQDRLWLATGYQLGDNWVRERYQRNQIMRGLTSCKPDDIIIIEDADEIVRPSILEHIEETIVDGSNAATQTLNTYYMNWQCINMFWAGSKILRYKFISNPSEDRFHTPAAAIIPDAGWHYNYIGGVESIKTKLKSFAHEEYATPETLDNIENRLNAKQDALGRLYEYKVIPIDENMPKYVLENPEKFRKYMYVP
jgi:beta-1,4-mannosyl-glycoprotein beta-1,4-N-acetylglucosaminyltransferase